MWCSRTAPQHSTRSKPSAQSPQSTAHRIQWGADGGGFQNGTSCCSRLTRIVRANAEFCQQRRKPASQTGTEVCPGAENKALPEPPPVTKVTSRFGEANANIVTTASSVTSSLK